MELLDPAKPRHLLLAISGVALLALGVREALILRGLGGVPPSPISNDNSSVWIDGFKTQGLLSRRAPATGLWAAIAMSQCSTREFDPLGSRSRFLYDPTGAYRERVAFRRDELDVFCPSSGEAATFAKSGRYLLPAGSVAAFELDAPSTFVFLGAGGYGKDADRAYEFLSGDGAYVVPNADLPTFYSDDSLYPLAVDKAHVYLGSAVQGTADGATFQAMPYDGPTRYYRDKVSVYYLPDTGAPIMLLSVEGADPKSFRPVRSDGENVLGEDHGHVYLRERPCPELATSTTLQEQVRTLNARQLADVCR